MTWRGTVGSAQNGHAEKLNHVAAAGLERAAAVRCLSLELGIKNCVKAASETVWRRK